MGLYDGDDTTIFASDWPHHDFDHPSKVHQIPFSGEVRRKVFGENALRLFKIDARGTFLVVRAEDPGDWLVRFEKSPGFPAREWAENMASIYNRRLSKRRAGTRPGSYHPEG
jgi:hypothetical protein